MKPSKKAIITLFLAVPVIWGVAWFFLSFITDPAQRGQFGDMFGAVNALFSGWAFVGVIVAILLQKEELELQRNELEETRKEFQQQNETLKMQRFENTFFNMLTLHNEIVGSLKVVANKYRIPINGNREAREFITNRDVFDVILKLLHEGFEKLCGALQKEIKLIFEKEHLKNIHVEISNKDYFKILGHYYRNLYRIFVFIDESDISNKALYAKIVRAQLSDSELVLLYYNCYLYERGEKFIKYAEKYNLFDNLPVNEVYYIGGTSQDDFFK